MKTYSILDSLESHLSLTEATISHSYTSSMSYQYCTPSANMITSHPARYSSVRVIACVTRPIVRKKSSNIYKPQVQGVSLSTWGVVRRELCFQLQRLTKASQSRPE